MKKMWTTTIIVALFAVSCAQQKRDRVQGQTPAGSPSTQAKAVCPPGQIPAPVPATPNASTQQLQNNQQAQQPVVAQQPNCIPDPNAGKLPNANTPVATGPQNPNVTPAQPGTVPNTGSTPAQPGANPNNSTVQAGSQLLQVLTTGTVPPNAKNDLGNSDTLKGSAAYLPLFVAPAVGVGTKITSSAKCIKDGDVSDSDSFATLISNPKSTQTTDGSTVVLNRISLLSGSALTYVVPSADATTSTLAQVSCDLGNKIDDVTANVDIEKSLKAQNVNVVSLGAGTDGKLAFILIQNALLDSKSNAATDVTVLCNVPDLAKSGNIGSIRLESGSQIAISSKNDDQTLKTTLIECDVKSQQPSNDNVDSGDSEDKSLDAAPSAAPKTEEKATPNVKGGTNNTVSSNSSTPVTKPASASAPRETASSKPAVDCDKIANDNERAQCQLDS